MTHTEILALPESEVYRRVAEALWPLAGQTEQYWVLGAKELQSWDGVGQMVEAMIGRGYEPAMNYWVAEECEPGEGPMYEWGFLKGDKCKSHFSKLAWEAVARAVLLALAESEAAK